jgi:hypothetical protein
MLGTASTTLRSLKAISIHVIKACGMAPHATSHLAFGLDISSTERGISACLAAMNQSAARVHTRAAILKACSMHRRVAVRLCLDPRTLPYDYHGHGALYPSIVDSSRPKRAQSVVRRKQEQSARSQPAPTSASMPGHRVCTLTSLVKSALSVRRE